MGVAAAIVLIGGLAKAKSAADEGRAINKRKGYEAKIKERNATLALASAKEHEDRFRRSARKKVGALVSSVGSNGITLSGSALDVMYDNAIEDELEAQTIRFNGEQRAKGLREGAILDRRAGINARQAGDRRAVAGVISAAGSAASSSN